MTPEDVYRATRIVFEHLAQDDPSMGTWDEFLARCNSRKGVESWHDMVPDDARPDQWDVLEGEDRLLVEKVAAVIDMSRYPPGWRETLDKMMTKASR